MNGVLRILIVVVASVLFALITSVVVGGFLNETADTAADMTEAPADGGAWIVIPTVNADGGYDDAAP